MKEPNIITLPSSALLLVSGGLANNTNSSLVRPSPDDTYICVSTSQYGRYTGTFNTVTENKFYCRFESTYYFVGGPGTRLGPNWVLPQAQAWGCEMAGYGNPANCPWSM